MTKIWQEDVAALFEAAGVLVRKPLLASFCEATYEFDKNPKANWLYYAFLGFLRLALTIKEPEMVATVGVGSGLDGIAIYETLRPRQIKLIDINPAVIDVAHSNLHNYFTAVGAQVKWDVVLGNLCSPLRPESADLVYANIPTIPGSPADIFAGINSSSFFDPAWAHRSPSNLIQYYLGLQYEFLHQSRIALKPGGSAVIALGVRMPVVVVDELFQAAGFDGYESIILDLKEQSQPQAVVTAYAKQELVSGVQFDFYKEQAVDDWRDSGLSLKEFKESLLEWRVSAQEAVRLTDSGQKVYHLIAILQGKK